jgi:Flp pilus assembly pilin Flp
MRRLRAIRRPLGRALADQQGQVHIEYLLVVAAIAIPLLTVFGKLLDLLTDYYLETNFWNSMPFP